MKKFTTAIVFDHRGRTAKGNEGPLELRITMDRQRYYINTGVRVREDEWAGSVVGERHERDALNERLGYIVRRVVEEIDKMQRNGEKFDVGVVKDRVFHDDQLEEKDAFLKWLEVEIPRLNIGAGTRKRYVVMLNRLDEYKQIRQWSDLTAENLYKWDAWLHKLKRTISNGDKQAGKTEEYIGDGTVYNYHRTLKTMLSRAVKFGIIEHNPYERLKGEFKRGTKESVEYLTEEEIAAIESLHPMAGTQMAMARDLFVFQMYTGLSYSDSQAFDIADYKRVNGKMVAVKDRIKTGVPYVSQLLPQAVEILERYGMQVPKVNNQQYNVSLKTIQQALGIRTTLHSHLARHTFATRMLSMGAKIENVSRMLGHTNITQTQRYAKVIAKNVHEDFDMFEQKLKLKAR